jgi:hypothetical protein
MNVKDTSVIMTSLNFLTSFDLYHYDDVNGDDSAFNVVIKSKERHSGIRDMPSFKDLNCLYSI